MPKNLGQYREYRATGRPVTEIRAYNENSISLNRKRFVVKFGDDS